MTKRQTFSEIRSAILSRYPCGVTPGGVTEVDSLDHASGARVTGYEMHMGRTTGPALARPWLKLDGRPEGAVSGDGRVMGSYLHGIFGAGEFRAHWLAAQGVTADRTDHAARLDAALDAFAAEIEADLDLAALLTLAR